MVMIKSYASPPLAPNPPIPLPCLSPLPLLLLHALSVLFPVSVIGMNPFDDDDKMCQLITFSSNVIASSVSHCLLCFSVIASSVSFSQLLMLIWRLLVASPGAVTGML